MTTIQQRALKIIIESKYLEDNGFLDWMYNKHSVLISINLECRNIYIHEGFFIEEIEYHFLNNAKKTLKQFYKYMKIAYGIKNEFDGWSLSYGNVCKIII